MHFSLRHDALAKMYSNRFLGPWRQWSPTPHSARVIKVSGLPLVLVLRADLTSGARTVQGVIATFGGPWETARRLPLKRRSMRSVEYEYKKEISAPAGHSSWKSESSRQSRRSWLSECRIYLFIRDRGCYMHVVKQVSAYCCYALVLIFMRSSGINISIGPFV